MYILIKELDIHGCTTIEARKLIKEALKDQNISVLRIIHGYYSDILMKMVRKEFRTHPRVDHIELSMNKGLTDLVIKKGFL